MSSMLNSISSGDLQVRKVPRETPVKEDSIIDLLQSSEIEFDICPKNPHKVINFNTGFGKNNDLHYEDLCQKPKLKTPLYKENFLSEFVSEEDKAAARHALGLYNKNDVVAMSLLTAEEILPKPSDLMNVSVKSMNKGSKFFAPVTVTTAVYDLKGNSLDTKLGILESLVKENQTEILKINQISKSETVTSLGDVKLFLQGLNKSDNLKNTLDKMNQDMVRFEKTGDVIS